MPLEAGGRAGRPGLQAASTAVQVIAVTLLGLMAGFFFAFAVDVAPALAQLDASSYIVTMQWINRVVRNALFGSVYFGSALLPFVAAGLVWASGRRGLAAVWLLLALVYFGAVFWLTRSVNVPINNELALWNAASPPPQWQQAREAWNHANDIRAAASAACFVAAVLALALSGPKRT